MVKLANGSEAKKWITARIYFRSREPMRPKGKAKIGEIKSAIPETNPKNIVTGISGRIKILAGKETSEKTPVEYKISGRTIILAARVTETKSRILNLAGKK